MTLNDSNVNVSDFFVVVFKYQMANYNPCMIDITNSYHQLYQGIIFTDSIGNVKNALLSIV